MLSDKRILLICKENFSYPMFFIAKELQKNGNCVASYFIHPEESRYKRSEYNKHTYFNFVENLSSIKTYDLKNLCDEFDFKYKNKKVDHQFINYIEREFTHFKSLNLLLTSSQLTTRHYHSRFFFRKTSFEQNQLFIELAFKNVLNVFEDFEPDLILDLEDGELLRGVINEIAYKKNIAYINLDYPRFEDYKIPTYDLGTTINHNLINAYSKYYKSSPVDLANEHLYINQYRIANSIMPREFRGTITSQYNAESPKVLIKTVIEKFIFFWRKQFLTGNFLLANRNQILYSSSTLHFLFYLKVLIKKQILYRKNRYFSLPVNGDKYIYMPLHLIPESTTFVKAPFYIDELNVIEQVSKALPIGWKLYVKEHQAMVGERDLQFYNNVNRLPNVKMVKFNYYNDPKPWIDNSIGVIAISGTGAYEAAMLGKQSIVFSDVPFTLIQGVHRIRSFEDLPSLLSTFGPVDNKHSCAAYIAAVKHVGERIDLKRLLSDSETLVSTGADVNEKFTEIIVGVINFFSKAYENSKNMH